MLPPFTADELADDLIATFGDQAYHKGIAMVVESLKAEDRETCKALSQACLLLMGRGYHKKPKEHRITDDLDLIDKIIAQGTEKCN